MMFSQTSKAIRERSREIDQEAADLIRSGMAPWSAIQRATEIVDQRRRTRQYSDLGVADSMRRLAFGGGS